MEKKSIGSGQSRTNGSNHPDSAVIESASSIGNERSSSVAGKKIETELFPSSRKKRFETFRLAQIQIFLLQSRKKNFDLNFQLSIFWLGGLKSPEFQYESESILLFTYRYILMRPDLTRYHWPLPSIYCNLKKQKKR